MPETRPAATILIPAYNECDTLALILPKLKERYPDYEILVVDDGSTDGTEEMATRQGARVVRHPYNKGNGASVKTGLRNATGEAVVIFDADGQHDLEDIGKLLGLLGEYDLVVGARDADSQTNLGRGVYHFCLNSFASYLTGRPIPDATSGFRAARRDALREFIHLLPNGFSTPVTTTLSFIRAGYSVRFEPTTMYKRAGGKSKIKPLADGLRFFLIVFRMISLFSPMKVFLPVSLSFLLISILYTAIDIAFISQRPHIANTAVLLITMSILVFLIGLVSEQIAALRFERTEHF